MKIAIYIYEGITALDAIGPYESLSRLPDLELLFVSKSKGMIHTGNNILGINADYDIQSVSEADILIIPGGSTQSIQQIIADEDLLKWIKHIDAKTKWTCSVCTGTLVIGAAGLIKGLNVATHWRAKDYVPMCGAIYTGKRIEIHNKYITCAGVSAGIDMGLYLCGEIAGQEIAEAVQLSMEYDPKPPFKIGGADVAATPARVRLIDQLDIP